VAYAYSIVQKSVVFSTGRTVKLADGMSSQSADAEVFQLCTAVCPRPSLRQIRESGLHVAEPQLHPLVIARREFTSYWL
jgi:hypothetical protein